jgi:hypothetical protein
LAALLAALLATTLASAFAVLVALLAALARLLALLILLVPVALLTTLLSALLRILRILVLVLAHRSLRWLRCECKRYPADFVPSIVKKRAATRRRAVFECSTAIAQMKYPALPPIPFCRMSADGHCYALPNAVALGTRSALPRSLGWTID